MKKIVFTAILLALAGAFAYGQSATDSLQKKADSLRAQIWDDRYLHSMLRRILRANIEEVAPVLIEKYEVYVTNANMPFIGVRKKKELKRDMKALAAKIKSDRKELFRLQNAIKNEMVKNRHESVKSKVE